MAREFFNSNLVVVLGRNLCSYYELESYYPLAQEIFKYLKLLDDVSYNRASASKEVHFINGIPHIRQNQLTVSSQQIGLYTIILDPPQRSSVQSYTLPGQSVTYHGSDEGTSKIYKRGGVKFDLIEEPILSGKFRVANIIPILKLAKRSPIHLNLMKQSVDSGPAATLSPPLLSSNPTSDPLSLSMVLTSPLTPPLAPPFTPLLTPPAGANLSAISLPVPPILPSPLRSPSSVGSTDGQHERILRSHGFDPEVSAIYEKPGKHSPVTRSVYTRDLGLPITTPDITRHITPDDYPLIADTIIRTGLKNPFVFLPYDFKPEHILVRLNGDRKEFSIIDFIEPKATPVYISREAKEFINVHILNIQTILSEGQLHPEVIDFPDTIGGTNKLYHPKYSGCLSGLREMPTLREKIYFMIASAIVATFVSISVVRELPTNRSELLHNDASLLNSIVLNALEALEPLPTFFVSGPPQFADWIKEAWMLALNAHVSHIVDSTPNSYNWYGVLTSSYGGTLWKN